MFTRYIGNMIGYQVPPYHHNWNDAPPEYTTSIIRRLRKFFILDPSVPEWPKILTGIERECQDRYRDRKSKLKMHFEKVGGYKDIANARRNPPPHLEPENWDQTVDLFLDLKYKNRSEKNAQNRSHAKYPSLHGSSSYIATRYKKEAMLAEKDAQTQEHGLTSSSVNEKEIITKVLGERRGHNRGIGRKLKGSTYSSFFEPPNQ